MPSTISFCLTDGATSTLVTASFWPQITSTLWFTWSNWPMAWWHFSFGDWSSAVRVCVKSYGRCAVYDNTWRSARLDMSLCFGTPTLRPVFFFVFLQKILLKYFCGSTLRDLKIMIITLLINLSPWMWLLAVHLCCRFLALFTVLCDCSVESKNYLLPIVTKA